MEAAGGRARREDGAPEREEDGSGEHFGGLWEGGGGGIERAVVR